MITLMLLVLSSSLFPMTIEQIRKSGDYYYGEGTASLYQEARDRAISNLSENIIVNVSISIENMTEELNFEPNEYTRYVFESYSIQTLRNLQEFRNPVGSRMNVFVYIHKDELEKIFNERRELIYDIYQLALESENNTNIGNALKYLYYSTLLMYSLPEETLNYRGIAFHRVLPAKIREMLQNTRFVLASIREISPTEKQVLLNMIYKDKPVQYMRFHFWDGSNQILIEGRDGRAAISLFGASRNLRRIDIYPDYMYYDQRFDFKAVSELWNLVKKPDYSTCITVSIEKPAEENLPERKVVAADDSVDYDLVQESIQKETDKFLQLIRANDVRKIRNVYPDDEYLQRQIRSLLELNRIQIIDTDTHVTINPTYEGWELRSIPIIAHYPSINKQSTESIVLNFDHRGMLSDVQFTVFEGMYEAALANIEDEEEFKQRQILIRFVEKYRSSFLYRDIETIETLFSDEAVIIVGRVLRRAPLNKEFQFRVFGEEPDIEYITHTKKSYLQALRNLFSKYEDIHVGFNSLKIVVKNNEPGIYSVSMRQNYNSTGYADEGYLFLLIDFNEPEPKIYVRSWQPNEWSRERMIEMANFRLN
jgi:hypothetical protein